MLIELKTAISNSEIAAHILINIKKQAISVSINTFTVYTFDLNGRLISTVKDGHTFRRSLDNRIMEKWSEATNGKRKRYRHWLNLKDRQDLINKVHYDIWNIFLAIQQDRFNLVTSSEILSNKLKHDILRALDKIVFYDFFKLETDAKKFADIYKHVGILPPDMYLALVLQITEGCSYNHCTFCNFYKGINFRIKPDYEFLRHIQEIKDFYQHSLKLRKYIFLGEANALDVPHERLVKFFDIINEQFCFEKSHAAEDLTVTHKFKGIFSFITAFHHKQKSPDDFAELKAKHLERVYIGLETGSDELLHFLRKPGKADNAIKHVQAIKQGGVSVGIIILLGAGGDKYNQAHISDTITAINAMNLDANDMVYFSPIIQYPESEYARLLTLHHIKPIFGKELENQKQVIIAGFNFRDSINKPKLALYDVNEFIY